VKIANVGGRLKLLVGGGAVDVESATGGKIGADSSLIYERLDELASWAPTISEPSEAFDPVAAGPPSPLPRQVFGIGLNYLDHVAESGFEIPEAPVVFTKYVSSFSGPITNVTLPRGSVDWEVELVAVIGRRARGVSAANGWNYVAGLTVGQDISERELQRSGPASQFGMAKSFAGFSPMGPALVTPDEFDRADDLAIGCEVNGDPVQNGRTSEMIFSIPQLVSYLSGVVELLPGDIIYSGTPSGVGMGRTPPRYLQAGDHLHSWVEGLGELDQHFVASGTTSDLADLGL
jgi:2,4-didehydro-3-deoxy-L-rhamnonate hydrolase